MFMNFQLISLNQLNKTIKYYKISIMSYELRPEGIGTYSYQVKPWKIEYIFKKKLSLMIDQSKFHWIFMITKTKFLNIIFCLWTIDTNTYHIQPSTASSIPCFRVLSSYTHNYLLILSPTTFRLQFSFNALLPIISRFHSLLHFTAVYILFYRFFCIVSLYRHPFISFLTWLFLSW